MFLKKIMVAMGLVCVLAGTSNDSIASAVNVNGLPDFAVLAEQQGRTVVNISTRQTSVRRGGIPEELLNDPMFEFFRHFGRIAPPREQQTHSLGSGFIVSSDGYVLTNAHVVAQADEITVTLNDKREFKAKLIGADQRTDVAVLKIAATGLPAVTTGNPAALRAGEWVVAIGSPFGFENSVTAGIVSAIGRHLPDDAYVPFIQTDVAINPGNSGGPLFNLKGQVVGINSQIYSRSGGFMGISFAIPIDVALQISDQLKTRGRVIRGRIGVSIQPLSSELARSFGLERPQGALINAVEAGGPAERAGLQSGDIILKVNGKNISSSADLPREIGLAQPGRPIVLDVWRQRAILRVTVTPDEFRDAQVGSSSRVVPASPRPWGLARLGVRVVELTAEQRQRLDISFGVQVVRASMLAQRAGMLAGDVIVGVGVGMEEKPLTSAQQLRDEVLSIPDGGTVLLRVLRRGQSLFLAMPVGAE